LSGCLYNIANIKSQRTIVNPIMELQERSAHQQVAPPDCDLFETGVPYRLVLYFSLPTLPQR
jgi:hypothetical protein